MSSGRLKNCQRIIQCHTTYTVSPESPTSGSNNRKVRISASAPEFLLESQCSTPSEQYSYNPCNDGELMCCYNPSAPSAGAKYTPLDQNGQCPIVCSEWILQTTPGVEQKRYWEYSNTPMSTDCPDPSHSIDPSDYLLNSDNSFQENQCTGEDDQVVFTLNGAPVTCGSSCGYDQFDRVNCVQLEYNSTIEKVDEGDLNDYCTEEVPELSSVFVDSPSVSSYIELDSTKQTELGSKLCSLSNIGISNLYVVLGRRSTSHTVPTEVLYADDGDYAHIFNQLTQFDRLTSNGNFVDKVNEVVPTSYDDLIFGAWDLDSKTDRGNGNFAKRDYHIITTDLQPCAGFYNSKGIDTDVELTVNADNSNTKLVEFEFVDTTNSAIYKTGSCPEDPFYKLTNSNVSCIYIDGSVPPTQYCCVQDYSNQNEQLAPDSDYNNVKTCTSPSVTATGTSPSLTATDICYSDSVTGYINELAIETTPTGYMCGPAPASNTDNILNDQGTDSLINMYPGYDYQYIDYAYTTHTYYNGDHSSNDPPIS